MKSKMIIIGKLKFGFQLIHCAAETLKHLTNIRTLLHGNNAKLVFFIQPNQELLVDRMENTSSFWPITIGSSSFQKTISLERRDEAAIQQQQNKSITYQKSFKKKYSWTQKTRKRKSYQSIFQFSDFRSHSIFLDISAYIRGHKPFWTGNDPRRVAGEWTRPFLPAGNTLQRDLPPILLTPVQKTNETNRNCTFSVLSLDGSNMVRRRKWVEPWRYVLQFLFAANERQQGQVDIPTRQQQQQICKTMFILVEILDSKERTKFNY